MFHLHSQSPGWPNGGVCHERVDTTSQFSLKSFTDSWWFLGLSYPSVAKDHHYALETCEMPCLPASISTSLQRWKRSSLQAKLCQTQNIATHVVHAGPMSDVCRTCISLYALKEWKSLPTAASPEYCWMLNVQRLHREDPLPQLCQHMKCVSLSGWLAIDLTGWNWHCACSMSLAMWASLNLFWPNPPDQHNGICCISMRPNLS